jgi:hypothetical protein
MLELKGFHVLLATDGPEAIDTALRKRPDLGAYSAKAAGSQRLYGNTSNEKMR